MPDGELPRLAGCRCAVRLALLGVLVATSAFAAADRAAIAALPEFARIDARGPTVLVLRGTLGAASRQRFEARARAVVADVGVRFLSEAAPKRPVDVCLFERAADYRAFADQVMGERPSDLGFYSPQDRVVVVNLEAGPRNMSHELAHPLLGDDFPAIPSWLNEGIGSLYGGSDVTARGVRFDVNYRIRDVRRAISGGTLPPISALGSVDPGDVYGERAMLWYGYARAALLLLESEGELEAFYAAVRGGAAASAELGRRTDDAAFARFTSRAKEGQRIEPPPKR
jgi:hypothetical protein